MDPLALPSSAVAVRTAMIAADAVVRPDQPVPDAARLLLDHGLSSLPVVDDDGALVGILSEYDIITKRGKLVEAVMTRGVITVPDDADLKHVAELIGLHGVRRLPVVRDGRLVGMIGRPELLRAQLEAGRA